MRRHTLLLALAVLVAVGALFGAVGPLGGATAEAAPAPASYWTGCKVVAGTEAVAVLGHDYWSPYDFVEVCYYPAWGWAARYHDGYGSYGAYRYYGFFENGHVWYVSHPWYVKYQSVQLYSRPVYYTTYSIQPVYYATPAYYYYFNR